MRELGCSFICVERERGERERERERERGGLERERKQNFSASEQRKTERGLYLNGLIKEHSRTRHQNEKGPGVDSVRNVPFSQSTGGICATESILFISTQLLCRCIFISQLSFTLPLPLSLSLSLSLPQPHPPTVYF